MKPFSTILLFIIFVNNLFSQSVNRTVAAYSYRNGIIYSHLLLSSDSNFYIVTGGCVDAGISKGRWQRENGKLYLKGVSTCETEFKITINTQLVAGDPEVTFKVIDVFGKPVQDYKLIFFDSTFKETKLRTDKKGVLTTKRGEYAAFYTQNEEQLVEVGNVVNDKVHYLWDKLTRYTIKMNYPTNVLVDREISIHTFSNRVFIASGEKLLDIQNKRVYNKL